jgi:hypothetical protein
MTLASARLEHYFKCSKNKKDLQVMQVLCLNQNG